MNVSFRPSPRFQFRRQGTVGVRDRIIFDLMRLYESRKVNIVAVTGGRWSSQARMALLAKYARAQIFLIDID